MSEKMLIDAATVRWLLGEEGDFECPPDQYFRGKPALYFWRKQLRAALAPQPVSVPEGWKLVPVLPTPSMIDEAADYYEMEYGQGWSFAGIFRAMLAAAPVMVETSDERTI